jgi:hypothetical protein
MIWRTDILLSEKDAIERAYGALSCVAETTMAKSEDLRRSASDAFVNIQLITSLTTCTLEVCIFENLRTEQYSNLNILEPNRTEQFGKKFGNSSGRSSRNLLKK